MAQFPQELLDSVIENVDDSLSLSACALVSTTFRVPSQRNLFRKLEVRFDRSGTHFHGPTVATAAALFKNSPLLASYVRELRIDLSDTNTERAAVAAVFRLLTHIEQLAIIGDSRSTPWLSRRAMRSDLSAALLECIARPSLRLLRMTDVYELPTVVCAAMLAVPVLSLQRIRRDKRERGESHERNLKLETVPRLRHLILSDPASTAFVLEFLLHSDNRQHITHIKHLELCPALLGRDDEPFFRACAATLEDLGFYFPALFPPLTYSFPTFLCVRNLKITLDIDSHRRIQPALPAFLTSAVAALPFLETMCLRCSIRPLPSGATEPEWDDHAQPFLEFASSGAVAAALPRLRRVQCTLALVGAGWLLDSAESALLMARFAAMMGARMPGLQGTGILVCELEAGEFHPGWAMAGTSG